MPYHTEETIAAVASAAGGAFRGIVRLSGPDVVRVVGACFRPAAGIDLRQVRRATAVDGTFRAAGLPSPLPCALYLWPSARSYTRQPVAELHTVGAPPLLEQILETVCRAGARLAEPGEFTLRAFLAGRIDLTQAEAVLAVIDADGPRPFETALAQLAGGLARPISGLREELLELLAHLEAGLDFCEEDIEFIPGDRLERRLAAAAGQVDRLITQMDRRDLASVAVRVVLSGLPNTGKSSLLNALVGRRVAITSPRPGTTRDYVRAAIDLDGLAVELIDTAGLSCRAVHCGPDRTAQQIARAEQASAAVELFCLDVTRPLDPWERSQLRQSVPRARILVLTKADLARQTDFAGPAIETSSMTGHGIESLREALRRAILQRRDDADRRLGGAAVPGTSARCRDTLRQAATALDRARRVAAQTGGDELVAADLREALLQLGKVVGAVYTEDVLDRIFSRFCIGK